MGALACLVLRFAHSPPGHSSQIVLASFLCDRHEPGSVICFRALVTASRQKAPFWTTGTRNYLTVTSRQFASVLLARTMLLF